MTERHRQPQTGATKVLREVRTDLQVCGAHAARRRGQPRRPSGDLLARERQPQAVAVEALGLLRCAAGVEAAHLAVGDAPACMHTYQYTSQECMHAPCVAHALATLLLVGVAVVAQRACLGLQADARLLERLRRRGVRRHVPCERWVCARALTGCGLCGHRSRTVLWRACSPARPSQLSSSVWPSADLHMVGSGSSSPDAPMRLPASPARWCVSSLRAVCCRASDASTCRHTRCTRSAAHLVEGARYGSAHCAAPRSTPTCSR